MSKANEQKSTAPKTGSTSGAADLAMVQSAQTGQADELDEFHGEGGLFQVIDGKRQRVAEQPVTTKE